MENDYDLAGFMVALAFIFSMAVPLVIGFGDALRWKMQMETPYHKLSESEKESDRREVRKYYPHIVNAESSKWRGLCERMAEAIKEVLVSGVEHEDPRIDYKSVQITDGTFDMLRGVLAEFERAKGSK